MLSVFSWEEVHDWRSSPSCFWNEFFQVATETILDDRWNEFPASIHRIKYLHSGIRKRCMRSDLCVWGLLMLCAWAYQNQQLYLGHLYSGASQWGQSQIQAVLEEVTLASSQFSPAMDFLNLNFAPPFPQLSNIYWVLPGVTKMDLGLCPCKAYSIAEEMDIE